MFYVYDAIKNEFLAREPLATAMILAHNLKEIKEKRRHETVKLQVIDINGKVYAEAKTCNW